MKDEEETIVVPTNPAKSAPTTATGASTTGWKNPAGQSIIAATSISPPRPSAAVLRFSPYAWAKFKYLRDKGSTEVAAFGIGTLDDPLAIVDVIMVKQESSSVTAEMNDEAVSNYFEDQVDLGRKPHQFARVWLHTHPGDSATPSGTDEETFTRVFGRCDWAVMAVLARGGDLTSRLRYNTGIRAEFEIKVKIDYSLPFGASDHEAWDKEYKETLVEDTYFSSWPAGQRRTDGFSYPQSPNFHGHMPGRSRWDEMYDPERHRNRHLFDGPASSRITSPRSRGIIVADATEKGEEDPVAQLSSDDAPELAYWPLEVELEDKTIEEQAELLGQLQLTSDDVCDYICYHDDEGVLTVELSPDMCEEADAAEATGFTDEAGDLVMNGFTDSKESS